MGIKATPLPVDCDGCARILSRICLAFTKPEGTWGKYCWAYQVDETVVQKELAEALTYTKERWEGTFDPDQRRELQAQYLEARETLRRHEESYTKRRRREKSWGEPQL